MKNTLLSPSEAIERLEKLGVNQLNLAKLLGISQGAVSKIKTKRTTNVSYKITDELRKLVASLSSARNERKGESNDQG